MSEEQEERRSPKRKLAKPAQALVAQPSGDLAAPDPYTLIVQAVQGGLDVGALEALIRLKHEHDSVEARKAFIRAFSAAHDELVPVVTRTKHVEFRNSKGQLVKYAHAELADVLIPSKPILARHGISLSFEVEQPGGQVKVTCHLAHRDGHVQSVAITAPIDNSGSKNPHQAICSAVTYLQRYTARAALGLAEHGSDDDGRGGDNGASEQQTRSERAKQTAAKHANDAVTENQLNRLASLAEDPRLTENVRAWILGRLAGGNITKGAANGWILKYKTAIAQKTGAPYEPWEDIQARERAAEDAALDPDAPPEWMQDDEPEREPGEDG